MRDQLVARSSLHSRFLTAICCQPAHSRVQLRAFLIRNLDYPPTIELPIERIKNRSRAEMQWRYRRQHALANVEQVPVGVMVACRGRALPPSARPCA